MEHSEDRNMTGKVISSSYKGILRVANNLNLIDYTTDTFLAKDYYTNTADKKFYGNGVNSTSDFLSSSAEIKRFKSEKECFNLKLPVTDSEGNFMNFYLGSDGSTIGSYFETQKYTDGKALNFAITTATNPIHIGLEERKLAGAKAIKGGSLNISSGPGFEGALVIDNLYNYNDKKIANIENGRKVRTVFPTNLSTTPTKKFDFLFYSQEDYNYDSNKNSNDYKDCRISLKNLSEYVRSKVDNYLATNEAPVPTGTIINQFCSLDKWFCTVDDSGNIDDLYNWQGYRPSMYNTGSTFAYFNLINNRAIKTDAQLLFDYKRTTELPPDFKRGYVLCDGGPITFSLAPSSQQSKENEQDSLRLFFDLFRVIGYYYHNSKTVLPPFHKCIKQADGSYRYSPFDTNDAPHFVSISTVNYDVAYAITMATVLTFKKLDEEYSKNNGSFKNEQEVLSWLRQQKIDEEYIFNAISPKELADSLPNNYYKYNNGSLGSKTFYINIGREINSFADEIPYYSWDDNTKEYKLVSCPIYKTAEAYHLVELFINRHTNSASSGISSRQHEWNEYVYTFYVPQLYTKTDRDANLAAKFYDSEKENVKIGLFPGSNGILAAKNLTISESDTQTINLDQSYSLWQSNYRNFIGYVPHIHALGKGRTELVYGTLGANPENSKLPAKFIPKSLENNIIKNANEEDATILKTDYRGTPKLVDKIQLPGDQMNNYVLFEVKDSTVGWKEVINSFSGTHGEELQNGNYFKWYGRTSEPIWASNDISELTTKFESQSTHPGYFRPESVSLLPLIKL